MHQLNIKKTQTHLAFLACYKFTLHDTDYIKNLTLKDCV